MRLVHSVKKADVLRVTACNYFECLIFV